MDSFFVLLFFFWFARRRLEAARTAWCLALAEKLDHGLILEHACCPHVGGTCQTGREIGRCGRGTAGVEESEDEGALFVSLSQGDLWGKRSGTDWRKSVMLAWDVFRGLG